MLKFNRILFSIFLMACDVAYSNAFADIEATLADNVPMQVTGTIVAQPCNVTWPDSIIDLGSWSSYILNDVGQYANTQARPVTITLNNCPAGTSSADIVFTGVPDSTLPATIFANTQADGAQDIGLQMFYIANSTVLAIGNNTSVNVPIANNAGQLQFYARMITLHGQSTPGQFQSTITMNISWN